MKFRVLKTIGDELRNLRKREELPLSKVADKVGVSTVYISEIERDKKVPSDDVISKLADVYKIEECNLFEAFGRIPESMLTEITENSSLFEIIFQLSTDSTIKKEQKEIFYHEMCELYSKHFPK